MPFIIDMHVKRTQRHNKRLTNGVYLTYKKRQQLLNGYNF